MSNATRQPSWSSTIPLWLDGKEVTTTNTYDVVSPRTGQVLYKSSSASIEDAEKAIQSAHKAAESWSATKPGFRQDILLRAAAILEQRKDELFKLVDEETGAVEAIFKSDFNISVEACKSTGGLASSLRGHVPAVSDEGSSAMIIREPYGTVLAIAPWNVPYILGFRACLGPLVMGNTVILKGSESSPGAYWAIASILHEAGLPAGCLNTITHRPQDAATITTHLIESPIIKKISFTGSTRTGAIIASHAAKFIKPTVMELGGKASTIVCDDADINSAALGCALGAFLHSGQICMSTERILVQTPVLAKFRDAFKAIAQIIFGGPDGLVLVNELSVKKNKQLVEDAISKGAKIGFGKLDEIKDKPTFMFPLIIEDVNKDMDIYETESFGPTVSLFHFDSDEEAIKIANDTIYGLTAAVFTKDLRRGMRIAKKIQAGAVHINSMSIHDESALPHGGFKSSGYGRFNGIEGLEEWVQTKCITWKD